MIPSKLTRALLYSISKHLSGRNKFCQYEYRVAIGTVDTQADVQLNFSDIEAGQIIRTNSITMVPVCYVFPSQHQRKPSDLQDVIDHVISYHFPELLIGRDDFGAPIIDCSMLVTGVYVYSKRYQRHRTWSRKL